MELFFVGDLGKHHNQSVGHDLADGSNRSLSWEDVFESFNTSSGIESQRKDLYPLNGNVSNTKNLSTFPSSHISYS